MGAERQPRELQLKDEAPTVLFGAPHPEEGMSEVEARIFFPAEFSHV